MSNNHPNRLRNVQLQNAQTELQRVRGDLAMTRTGLEVMAGIAEQWKFRALILSGELRPRDFMAGSPARIVLDAIQRDMTMHQNVIRTDRALKAARDALTDARTQRDPEAIREAQTAFDAALDAHGRAVAEATGQQPTLPLVQR